MKPKRRPKRKSPRPRPAANPAPRLTAKLIRIGNSRGIRLPKAVIEQARLGPEVEVLVRGHEVVLKSLSHPRAGWDEAMRQAIAEHGAELTDEDREWLDAPLDAPVDGKDWPW